MSADDAAAVGARLVQSARDKDRIVQTFGFAPNSVLRISRGALSKRMHHFVREHGLDAFEDKSRGKKGGVYNHPSLARLGKLERLRKHHGNENARVNFSIMCAELVDFFVKFYAAPGQTYLDPFMGQGVQMQVAKLRGMHYRGYDVCEQFYAFIDRVRQKVDDGRTTIQTVLGDSRAPDRIPDGCGDFCFTSPPYWDVEAYGPEPGQLGVGKTYEEFMVGMEDVARAWLPKFKPGAYAVLNVNDIRKSGVFYPYHSDLAAAFARAGWVPHDMWIIEGVISGMSKMFTVNRVKFRIAPKVHEYAMVFRAPGAKR